MERYDAAIVGAGPEGLVAAITLARARRRVIVIERLGRVGGRAETAEFHPGFKASSYTDELPPLPTRLVYGLDLARHGAILVPAPASVCISDGGTSVVFADPSPNALALTSGSAAGYLALQREAQELLRQIDQRALALAPPAKRRLPFFRRPRSPGWPGDAWLGASLEGALYARIPDALLRLHLTADAVSGRAVSPFLAGTALHLMAPGAGRSGTPKGGLGTISAALMTIAAKAGVTFHCGTEVKSIAITSERATALDLANGERIEARAILSTLDVKRTFLGLVPGHQLEDTTLKRVGRFRMAGQRARVLFALDRVPEIGFAREGPDARLGPIHVLTSIEDLSSAHDSWEAGAMPKAPLVTLRVPSLVDPSLAPANKAVMTATISGVPARLADGSWTQVKRDRLRAIVLAAAERAAPGISQHVVATETIIGPDIEARLGLTSGDLDGGDVAPDQVLASRPFADDDVEWTFAWADGRTPVRGLYLGGPSAAPAPFLLGVSGERAARAIDADIVEERLP